MTRPREIIQCIRCDEVFVPRSRQRICDQCQTHRCEQCEDEFCSTSHNRFCSLSCSSRWKAINDPGIRERFEKGRATSVSTRAEILSRLYKGKPNFALRGRRKAVDHPQSATNTIRRGFEYREWRTAVYERDDYTCQSCGERGGQLEAHHIRAYAECAELRFDVGNGVTLCQRCHREGEHGWNC